MPAGRARAHRAPRAHPAAAGTRASTEIKQHEAKHMRLAFLGCGKHHETANHAVARDCTLGTGLSARAANMVLEMYNKDLHVKAHRAMAPPRSRN